MNLKEQIDTPLVNTIALINLQGVKTLWCCCGYDYPNQIQKSHSYGTLQICMEDSINAQTLGLHMISIIESVGKLQFQRVNPGSRSLIFSYNFATITPSGWNMKEAIHFYELSSTAINCLEKKLKTLLPLVDQVVLHDTNRISKENNPYWQAEASDPWIIRKEDYYV
jgi:hypothetical protein